MFRNVLKYENLLMCMYTNSIEGTTCTVTTKVWVLLVAGCQEDYKCDFPMHSSDIMPFKVNARLRLLQPQWKGQWQLFHLALKEVMGHTNVVMNMVAGTTTIFTNAAHSLTWSFKACLFSLCPCRLGKQMLTTLDMVRQFQSVSCSFDGHTETNPTSASCMTLM